MSSASDAANPGSDTAMKGASPEIGSDAGRSDHPNSIGKNMWDVQMDPMTSTLMTSQVRYDNDNICCCLCQRRFNRPFSISLDAISEAAYEPARKDTVYQLIAWFRQDNIRTFTAWWKVIPGETPIIRRPGSIMIIKIVIYICYDFKKQDTTLLLADISRPFMHYKCVIDTNSER